MDLDLGSPFLRCLENIAEEEKLSDQELVSPGKSENESIRSPIQIEKDFQVANNPIDVEIRDETVPELKDETATEDNRSPLEIASDEWLKVPTVGVDSGSQEQQPLISPVIDVDEAFLYFRTLKLPQGSNSNNVASARVRWRGFVQWLHTPPKLNAHLKSDCDLVYSVVQCSLNWEDNVHWRMLQTVYKQLTGSKIDCPQYGSHWQLIGFQGSDPSTDLRGVGLLGLLQILYLSTKLECVPFARRLYAVANSDNQAFPLAVLSLNVTQIALNALRSGKLNKECNNRQAVLQVLNLFYIAILHYIFNIWVTEQKTIKDSGYLLKDAEKYCCKNVRKVLQDIPEQLEKYSKL